MKLRKILSIVLVTVMTVCLLNGLQFNMLTAKADEPTTEEQTTVEQTTEGEWTSVAPGVRPGEYMPVYYFATPTVVGVWNLYAEQGKGAMSYQGSGATTGDLKLRIDEETYLTNHYSLSAGLCATTGYHLEQGHDYHYTIRFRASNEGIAYMTLQYLHGAPEELNETISEGENVFTGTLSCGDTDDYNFYFLPKDFTAGTIIEFEEVTIEEIEWTSVVPTQLPPNLDEAWTQIGAWKMSLLENNRPVSYSGNGTTPDDLTFKIEEGASDVLFRLKTSYYMEKGKNYKYTFRYNSTKAGTIELTLGYLYGTPEFLNRDVVKGENSNTGIVTCGNTGNYDLGIYINSLEAGTIIDIEEFTIEEIEWIPVPGSDILSASIGGSEQGSITHGVWKLWDINSKTDYYSSNVTNYDGAISYKGSGETYRDLTLRIDEPVIFTPGAGQSDVNVLGIGTNFSLSNNEIYQYTVKFTSTQAGAAAICWGEYIMSEAMGNRTTSHQVVAGENTITGIIAIAHDSSYAGAGTTDFYFYPSDGTTCLPAGTEINFTEISFKRYEQIDDEDLELEGQCGDNAYWSFDRTTGQLEITGSGPMYSYAYYKNVPWYLLRSHIESVSISEGITSIGKYAFYNCISLTEADIPTSVTTIEKYAFYGCSSLLEADIPENVTVIEEHVFSNCCSLSEVYLSENITTIGNYAFLNCNSLTEINIPESVISINSCAFYYCSSLTDIYIYNEECSINDSSNTIPTAATIHGYTGSTAETYADKYGITFVAIDAVETTTEEPMTNDGWTLATPTNLYPGDGYDIVGVWKLYVYEGNGSISYIGNGATTGDIKIRVNSGRESTSYPGILARTSYYLENGKTYNYTIRFTSTNAGAASMYLEYQQGTPEQPDSNIVAGENIRTGSLTCYGQSSNYIFNFDLGDLPAGTIIDFEEVTIEEVVEETTTEEPVTEEPTTKEPVTEKPTTEPVTEDSAPEADFKIASKTLALSSGISLVFKVNKSLFENRYSEPKVVVLLDGIETEITEYKDEGSRYAFEFTKITPDKMNIMVEATLHASKNGKEYVSPVVEYSVATYAYNMLSKYGETAGMETFRTLLVDLLNYGTASQNYTGFNADNPANGDLTAAQRSWATGDLGELTSVKNNKYVTIDNPSVLWKSAGLALQDAVIVRMKIQADSTDGLIVRVTDDYGTTWDIEPEDFAPAQGTDNQYYVDFKGFNVGRMSESMYFTVLRNGVAVSNTYRYSVESYVLQYMNHDSQLGPLVVAMMKYGKSAQAYSS